MMALQLFNIPRTAPPWCVIDEILARVACFDKALLHVLLPKLAEKSDSTPGAPSSPDFFSWNKVLRNCSNR